MTVAILEYHESISTFFFKADIGTLKGCILEFVFPMKIKVTQGIYDFTPYAYAFIL